MTRPHFVGIGAQKAGTSWLHACLYEHPDIYMPASKEIHFFSKYYDQGIAWYEGHFQTCRSTQWAGEFSPTYMYYPDAAQRLHDYRPDMQLIVCLREPVARTVSAYRYAIQTGALSPLMPLAEVLQRYPAYVEHSRYTIQLQRYFRHFSRQQMLIIFYEDIAASPYTLLDSVYQFLGVDRHFHPAIAKRKVNASRGAPRVGRVDRWLKQGAASLRQAGFARLVWRLAHSRAVESMRHLNSRPLTPQPLSTQALIELHQSFASEIHALADLLGRGVPASWSAAATQLAEPPPTESSPPAESNNVIRT